VDLGEIIYLIFFIIKIYENTIINNELNIS